MNWDPDSTLRNALWIGGGQWAGKSTVSGILSDRFGLTHYHYDYHNAKGHEDRRIARQFRREGTAGERDFEQMWVTQSPQQMATEVRLGFVETFSFVVDDLRALTSPMPIIADGWGLRPELVVATTDAPERMVVLVPTDDFRRLQAARLPRATRVHAEVSDPARAQRNRLERDRLLAADAVGRARELGVPVIEVDGSQPAESIADAVAAHFAAFLPRRLIPAGGGVRS